MSSTTIHGAARSTGAALAAALALAACQPLVSPPPVPTGASAAPTVAPAVPTVAPAVPTAASAAPTAASPAAYDVPRMTPEEAQAAVARGEAVVFVDVRFKENYTLERIAGAVSAPWGELEAGHALLPKDKLLLLYCT